MKCVVIHGSPRKGNTWEVLDLVKEEMNNNGNYEFKDIELRKENIGTCIGCFNCIFKGENMCPHKESMSKIIKEIDSSDAFIITTPVYSMQVSGILKNFIDHMSFNFHRPRYFTKKALVIVTTAGGGHTDTANYIKSVLHYWGVNRVNTLPIAYRSFELTDKNRDKVLKGARDFALELNSGKLHKPSTKSVIMYNMWKCMSKEKYKDGSADYDYWKNPVFADNVFAPEVPIGFFNKTLGKVVCKVMKK